MEILFQQRKIQKLSNEIKKEDPGVKNEHEEDRDMPTEMKPQQRIFHHMWEFKE